jgi:hypothetical protein
VQVTCPFCRASTFSVLVSFNSHVRRKHSISNSETKSTPAGNNVVACRALDYNHVPTGIETSAPENMADDSEFPIHSAAPSVSNDRDNNMERPLAEFYLLLTAKHHVPSRIIQFIFDKYGSLLRQATDFTWESIHEAIQRHDGDLDSCTLRSLIMDNCLMNAHSPGSRLRTRHTRFKLYKELFKFVAPLAMNLGKNGSNKNRHYHYVPLRDSINALLADPTVLKQYHQNLAQIRTDNLIRDIRDGTSHTSHEILGTNTKAIQLIMYQDAFEIVNPLGSGRKKHKILGFYYTLGNIHAWNRSKVDPLQLVLLCKNVDFTYFGSKKVLKRLVREIKDLEENGIALGPDGEIVPVVLCSFLGDNLGSHMMTGHCENFRAMYFCRFCEIDMVSFQNGINDAPARTREKNEAYANQNSINNKSNNVMGIKTHAVLNELRYFNTVDNFPPCVAHDIYEGVIQYDLPLAINYFVNERGIFSYDYINRRLEQVRFRGADAGDPPHTIANKCYKLAGHAVQNWNFLRFMPLLVGFKINTLLGATDPVWQMVLLLIEIVRFICAPVTGLEQLAYLDTKIRQYLEMRRSLFPTKKLRPKHHFMFHYAHLAIKHGPLARSSTLRFESKHSYFSEVANHSKNFINITKTLSVKHQFLQAACGINGLFPDKDETKTENFMNFKTNESAYDDAIRTAIIAKGLNGAFYEVGKIASFRGVEYKTNDFVIIKCHLSHLLLGRILSLLLQDGNELYLILRESQGELITDMQLYEITEGNRIVILKPTELVDYMNYPLYDFNGVEVIVPKFAFDQK